MKSYAIYESKTFKEYNLARKGTGQFKDLINLFRCLLYESDRTTEKKIYWGLFFGSQRSLLGLFLRRKWVSFKSLFQICKVSSRIGSSECGTV